MDNIPNETKRYMYLYDYTVVIYIDSAQCTPCSLEHLKLWKFCKKDLEEHNTGILLIIHNSDEQLVIETLKSIGVFNFILDKGGKFKLNNEIFKIINNNVFVMDRNKNVIFTESPIANKKQWDLFIKGIKNNTKSGQRL
jgi:hypothetical protein